MKKEDATQVIRCLDCLHFESREFEEDDFYPFCNKHIHVVNEYHDSCDDFDRVDYSDWD